MTERVRLQPQNNAGVAKLVDALDLGSSDANRESSSLSTRIASKSQSRPLREKKGGEERDLLIVKGGIFRTVPLSTLTTNSLPLVTAEEVP